MRAPTSLARRAGTAARWPVGIVLTSWHYMWRTTPLHRRERGRARLDDDRPRRCRRRPGRRAPAAARRRRPGRCSTAATRSASPSPGVARGADGRGRCATPTRSPRPSSPGSRKIRGDEGPDAGGRRVRRAHARPVGRAGAGGRPDADLVPLRHPPGPPGGRPDRVPRRAPRATASAFTDRVVGPQRRPLSPALYERLQHGQGGAAAHVDVVPASGWSSCPAGACRGGIDIETRRVDDDEAAGDRDRSATAAPAGSSTPCTTRASTSTSTSAATTTPPRTAGRSTTTASRSRPSRPARRCRAAAGRSPSG